MKEIFKDIPCYEGLYQVSNLGKVKSLRRLKTSINNSGVYTFYTNERILKQSISKKYYMVSLTKNNIDKSFCVHKLVAMAFLGHIPDGRMVIVDHINNNSLDNRLENLQITTARHNASKDRVNKTSKYTGVSWDKTSNKWVSRIRVKDKYLYLGRHINEYDAHLAYQKALSEL